MALPPSPGSFSPWRFDQAPKFLAPKSETSGTFRQWRLDRTVAMFAAVQTAAALLSSVMGGAGAVVPVLTAGAPSLASIIPFMGTVTNAAFQPGGALLGTTVAGDGQTPGSLTRGSDLTGLIQRDVIIWTRNIPLSVLRPKTELTTGSMSFWRLATVADTLQIGPPLPPPPETFWRLGAAPGMARPK